MHLHIAMWLRSCCVKVVNVPTIMISLIVRLPMYTRCAMAIRLGAAVIIQLGGHYFCYTYWGEFRYMSPEGEELLM